MTSSVNSNQNSSYSIYLLPSTLYTAASDLAKKVQRVAQAVIAKIQTAFHSTYTYLRSFVFTAKPASSDTPDPISGETKNTQSLKASSCQPPQEQPFIDSEEGVKDSASEQAEKKQVQEESLMPLVFSEKLPEKVLTFFFKKAVEGTEFASSSQRNSFVKEIQERPFPAIKCILENKEFSAAFSRDKHRTLVETLCTGIENQIESMELESLITGVMKYFSLDAKDLTLRDKVQKFFVGVIDIEDRAFEVKAFVKFLIENKKD